MDDIEFLFLIFLMVTGCTCGLALCIQALNCFLMRFCDKKEKINILQIRVVENPIVVPVGTTSSNIGITIEEDPKIPE